MSLAPMPDGGGGGDLFARVPADAGTLKGAAARLSTAAGTFGSGATGIGSSTSQAATAWRNSAASLAFVAASGKVRGLTASSGSALGQVATATRTFGGVVEEVNSGIDELNRRYAGAMHSAQASAARQATAAANAPAPPAGSAPPPDPYAGVNSLRPQLQSQYEDLLTRYRGGAHTFAGALDSGHHGTNPKDIAENALNAVGAALGPTGKGFIDIFRAGLKGVKGVKNLKNLVTWLTSSRIAMMQAVNYVATGEAASLEGIGRTLTGGAKALEQLKLGSPELGPTMTKALGLGGRLLGQGGISEGALGSINGFKNIAGKAFLPLTVLTGGMDAITGGGDTGLHGVATRVMGGAGALGAGAILLGVSNPVGLTVAGGAVIAYGLYSAGNLIYKNRQAIGHAIETGAKWVGNTVSTLGSDAVTAVKDVGSTVIQGAGDVGHAVSSGVKSVGHFLSNL